jgi:hypothetical protein
MTFDIMTFMVTVKVIDYITAAICYIRVFLQTEFTQPETPEQQTAKSTSNMGR